MVQAREYTGTAVTGSTLKSALEYTYADVTNQVSAITAVSALGESTLEITYGDLSLAQNADYVYREDRDGDLARVYSYDALGRLYKSTTVTDVLSLQSVYTYRNISSTRTTAQVSSLQTAAGTFSYTYDSRGNLTSVSDGTYTTRYEYDIHGMLTRED